MTNAAKEEMKDSMSMETEESKPNDGKEVEKPENGDNQEDEKEDGGKEEGEKKKKEPFKYKDNFSGSAEEHEHSPFIWVKSKNLQAAVNKSLEATKDALKKIFEEELDVPIPKLKVPELMQLYIEMNSIEDKFKVLSNTNRPERFSKKGPHGGSSETATQSVVVKEEDFGNAKPGNIEEALDEILPLRKTLYKEQLALKSKGLEETADSATKQMQEIQAKRTAGANKKPIDTPKVESVVPMVPNVGYERNIFLNFEKEGKAKKIKVGVRVFYEKEGMKKVYLVPVSECVHVAPQIVKAAEAVADHFTKEKFEVFDGKTAGKDLYGVRIAMNEIGEIIMSVVIVIDDKFTEEFYDLTQPAESLPKEVTDYFARMEAKHNKLIPKKPDSKKSKEGDGDGKTTEEEVKKEDDGEKEDEDEEKLEEDAELDAKEDDAKEDDAKNENDKDQILILREGLLKPTSLEKTPFLRRVCNQIEESVGKFGISLKKFFEEKGPSLGISGVYMTWHATNKRPTDWSRNVKHWYHICGSKSMTETVNNIKTEVFPYLEVHNQCRVQSVPAICNAIIETLNIGSNTQAFVACDQYVVQKLFAQKCKSVAMFSLMNDMTRSELKAKHPSLLFISARANKQFNIVDRTRRHFGGLPDVLIHWGNYQEMPLKKIIQQRPKKMAVVLDPRDRDQRWPFFTNVDALRKMWSSLNAHYSLKTIVGVDICPMKDGSPAIVAFFDALPGRPNFNVNRGVKRKNVVPMGPGPKRGPMGSSFQNRQNNHPNQRNMGPMGGQRRFQPSGNQGGFNKRPRFDNRRPAPPPAPLGRGPMNRTGGSGGSRFTYRPGPNPWSDSRRMDSGGSGPFNGRITNSGGSNFNDNQPAEHTVQAAKAVLSQLSSIIENQMLANITTPGQGPRNRPDDSWSGGGRRDSGFGGFSSDQDYFSRDRSPPSNPISNSFDRRGYGSGNGGGGNVNRRNNTGGGGGRFTSGGRFNRNR